MSTQTIPAGTPWQKARRAEEQAVVGAVAEAIALRQALGMERQARKVAERRFSFLVDKLRGGADLEGALVDVEELFGVNLAPVPS